MSKEDREPTEEERQQSKAEADKAAAEAALAKFELEMKQKMLPFELREAEAKAVTAEHTAAYSADNARQVHLRTTDIERQHEWEQAHDLYHRVYQFTGAVSDATAGACMDQLNIWRRTAPGEPVEIVFNSPGGSVIAGMALFDHIQILRAEGHHVTTTTYGQAASMAGILLQAGDTRVMGRESWLLIHEASFGAMGKIGDVVDTVEWVKRVCGRILDIFTARCQGTDAPKKLTKKQIQSNWNRKDWWISSDDALAFGLVDEVR